MNRRQTLVAATRPPFLVLSPATVLLGVATAVQAGGGVRWLELLLVFAGALAAHIAVNTLNEYQDFHSGLDEVTRRTPFSGGSGALPSQPHAARGVLHTAVAGIAITIAIGATLSWLHGPSIIPIGLAGLAVIIAYTRWLNRNPWLSLLAPGVGFGLVVAGTHVAMGGVPGTTQLVAALISLCLTSNLLLLNQLPDINADRSVGRRTLPIVHGISASARSYGVLLLLAAALLLGAVMTGRFPPLALLALLPLAAGVPAWQGARQFAGDVGLLLPALGANVATAVLTPIVLGAAILLG
jgi:1,4-dihydroxy-2-naphthoate octaprenyltransferase